MGIDEHPRTVYEYRALGDQNDILFSPEVDKDATQLYIPVQSTNYYGTLVSPCISRLLRVKALHFRSTWGMSGNMFSNYCSVALEVQKGSLSIIIYPYLYDLYEYVMYIYNYIYIYVLYIYMINGECPVGFQVELHSIAGLHHCRLHAQGMGWRWSVTGNTGTSLVAASPDVARQHADVGKPWVP